MTIEKYSGGAYSDLVALWERSVRSTHHFLTEDDISAIRRALVGEYFSLTDLYVAKADGETAAFIGLGGDMIEMLFVAPEYQGRGIGTALLDFARARGATRVDVNEQNEAAHSFYLRKGFVQIGRSPLDPMGKPFPILHLERKV